MEQYINKSALVAEIEKRKKAIIDDNGNLGFKDCQKAFNEIDELKKFINTLEVKEVDLEQEIKNEIDNLSNLYCYMEDLFNGNEEEGVYPIPENVKNELFEFAKHFFELGLKTQRSSIDIPNIDDILEEDGIDPNSKTTKIFKESYYMALERLKEGKGE